MSRLGRFFKSRKALNYRGEDIVLTAKEPIRSNSISANGMNLTVYNATGGHIVEVKRYDKMEKHEGIENRLYIIPSDKEFSEALAKIVAMEMIR